LDNTSPRNRLMRKAARRQKSRLCGRFAFHFAHHHEPRTDMVMTLWTKLSNRLRVDGGITSCGPCRDVENITNCGPCQWRDHKFLSCQWRDHKLWSCQWRDHKLWSLSMEGSQVVVPVNGGFTSCGPCQWRVHKLWSLSMEGSQVVVPVNGGFTSCGKNCPSR
jgi:hypothetical protein